MDATGPSGAPLPMSAPPGGGREGPDFVQITPEKSGKSGGICTKTLAVKVTKAEDKFVTEPETIRYSTISYTQGRK